VRDNASNPFRVPTPSAAPFHYRLALTMAQPFLDWTLGLPTYRDLYRETQRADGRTFAERALRVLDIDVTIAGGGVADIPSSGPLLVVANHPHGILDGLALAHLVDARRGDVRVLTSHLLASIPDLGDLCLFVDPYEGGAAAARSRAGLRAARRWLDGGHSLIVFPAGTVAHHDDGTTTPPDSPWRSTAARLAMATDATVMAAFIHGRNSDWFYRAARIHPWLRTLLLGRELLRHRGQAVTVSLGAPRALAGLAARDPSAMTDVLRREVEELGSRTAARCPVGLEPIDGLEPIAEGPTAVALEREVRLLPIESRLIQSGPFDVFCASAASIPMVLRELGRLRELSFRAVGEGTGKALDLDRFDKTYRHLFVWNRDAKEIVGAYRLGLTDDLVASQGLSGLYTATLFRYDARLLARLGPAVELGRSFVRAEYQRSSNALLLLWKGIARFVAQSERYRVLFGPVSISSRYADMSQRLLREFLTQNHCRRDLAALVESLTPPATPLPHAVQGGTLTSIAELDRAIVDIEADGKGVPVLLRQYLKLNAKLLGFNVDANFGNALDALMMVDLADVAPAVRRRYFGDDAHHFGASRRVAA
jgi:putative hemolysin